ncbi:MAG: DNA translocase FtsK [Candidatus Azobacteroides pseudotrichonymphae]|jgi:S-DNA-T family DNA segregation ATPase FtsK/SpoIIIE|nr:DNA translocase FtsK [Bacteroidales bacterium OttesenSCG-928-I14]GMO34708.1 MAG: DNA translocase FtsK [Candidatus Azobacteroides pseudotrichonymphae]
MQKKSTITKTNTNSKFSTIRVFFQSSTTHYFVGLIILIIVVYTSISIFSFFFTSNTDQSKIEGLSLFQFKNMEAEEIANWAGLRGAILSSILMNEGFGLSTFFLLLFTVFVALRLMKVYYVRLIRNFILCSLLTIWLSITLTFFFGKFFQETALYIGGKHGFIVSNILVYNFGTSGTLLIIVLLFIISIAIVNIEIIYFLITPKQKNKNKIGFSKEKKIENAPHIPPFQTEENFSNGIEHFEVVKPKEEETIISEIKEKNRGFSKKINKDNLEKVREYDPTLGLPNYLCPPINLLKECGISELQIDMEEQKTNKNKILSTLDSFGIKIAMIKATVGPTVTLYEIQPEAGIRISKIKNLEDDIALRLSALGIRIIAPIPGKGTIGIEVPNRESQTVSMKSVITSKKFQETKLDLPIALGKTITNETFVFDLCKMPHLLVAGATGQGKSVGLNAIITSLLYKKHPAQLKFVLIDPKKVEFNIYSEIEKHFLAKLPNEEDPVITNVTKVVQTLNSLTKEVDERYNLLKKANVRNMKEYNEKFVNRQLNPQKKHRYMPYFVVIIDEFGDLIMTAGREIELPIARIAQLARAVGIHMIIATQRPDTSIITGIIKANFPARIAFRVSAMVDSRTILDTSGANHLVGKGDLLFSQGNDLTRIQCAFVDTSEVEKITEYISNQQGYPNAEILPEYTSEDNIEKRDTTNLSNRDPLFNKAARLMVTHQQGSTSLIQRKFEIGYNRAGRLMDQLEDAGIVGSAQGSKAREVLISDEYHLDKILELE